MSREKVLTQQEAYSRFISGHNLGCIVSLSQVMIIVDIPHPDLAQFALILV
jgi:hypothetical protein